MTTEKLISRLEKAEGPDRELDFWISSRVFDPCDYSDEELQADIDKVGIDGMSIEAAFTGSIDAAVALAEKLLPDAQVLIGWKQTSATRPWARVGNWSSPDATGSTVAIALCIAVLKAKHGGFRP